MLKENLKMNSPGTGAYVKVIRDALMYPPRAHTTTTALHVLGMPRH